MPGALLPERGPACRPRWRAAGCAGGLLAGKRRKCRSHSNQWEVDVPWAGAPAEGLPVSSFLRYPFLISLPGSKRSCPVGQQRGLGEVGPVFLECIAHALGVTALAGERRPAEGRALAVPRRGDGSVVAISPGQPRSLGLSQGLGWGVSRRSSAGLDLTKAPLRGIVLGTTFPTNYKTGLHR